MVDFVACILENEHAVEHECGQHADAVCQHDGRHVGHDRSQRNARAEVSDGGKTADDHETDESTAYHGRM
ncbi:hypothetical protein D3C87_2150240 [compost metagenome]